MRTQLTLGALAAVATSALTGLGIAAPATAMTPSTEQATDDPARSSALSRSCRSARRGRASST